MSKQIWFLTGSQGLYGDDVLLQVRDQSAQISNALAGARRSLPRSWPSRR